LTGRAVRGARIGGEGSEVGSALAAVNGMTKYYSG
jgi:hypothetical protein